MSIPRTKQSVIFLIMCLLILILPACSLMPAEEEVPEPPLVEPPEVTYKTVAAEKGYIEDAVTVMCTFESTTRCDTYFTSAEGRITLINAELGMDVAEGDLLLTLDTESLEYSIRIQELSVERSQMAYDMVKESYDSGTGSEYDLKNAEIDLEMAKLQLESLTKTLERSILYAPMSGVITYMSPNVSLGTYVSPYDFLYTIEDTANLQLQYSGSDAKLRSFKAGMEVNVNYKNADYVGKVISVTADSSSGGTQKVLVVEAQGLPDTVERNDSASVKLILDSASDTIIIKKSALKNYNGRDYVQILEDGVKKERDVVTGITTTTEVEIVEGLDEGDLVIMD
jgi:RND family efflux transporter MFP subunit